MITLHPTDDQIARARQLYDFDALKNSITRGGGNLTGAVGEVCFGDYTGWAKVESYSHDFVSPDGRTLDVKSKKTLYTPKPEWSCTVAETSTHQKPDIYFFARVHENLNTCWLLGWLEREEFFNLATFGEKGEVDPESRAGWTYRADCWNIRISELRPVETLR